MGKESNGVPKVVRIELTKDTRDGKARSISMKSDRKVRVKVFEDGSSGKVTLEFFKSRLYFSSSAESFILFKKGGNRCNYIGVALDKTAIEVAKAKKDLDIAGRGNNGSFSNSSDPIRVYRNTFSGDDKVEER